MGRTDEGKTGVVGVSKTQWEKDERERGREAKVARVNGGEARVRVWGR